jgi:chromosome segregation ATPase
VFSNRDVERFKQPSDLRPVQPKKEVRDERKTDARMAKNTIERERWCKRATEQKNKIEKAQYEVQTAEKKLKHEEETNFHGGKKSTQLQDKLGVAKRKLASEEKELTDIESEAHRKGVPPGWLRCQAD